jgi:hypothetical protein
VLVGRGSPAVAACGPPRVSRCVGVRESETWLDVAGMVWQCGLAWAVGLFAWACGWGPVAVLGVCWALSCGLWLVLCD